MKKEEMLRGMELIDDKYVAEADPVRLKAKRRRRWAAGLCSLGAAAVAAMWLFIPFRSTAPSVRQYAGSDYYEVIQKLNEATYTKPRYKNNMEKHVLAPVGELLSGMFDFVSGGVKSDAAQENMGTAVESGGGEYEEITDNQVAGVIEADLIKRSDKYIYYLSGDTLRVYSIAGLDSKEVGSYVIGNDSMFFHYNEEWEFYLSKDCETAIIAAPFANKEKKSSVGLIALDVSDPTNITEKGMFAITGGYMTSRYVDGDVLLMTEFRVGRNPDFSDETLYLPQIDTGDGMESIPADSIIYPEELSDSRYTVVCKVDGETMELEGCSAFLSYSEEVYVSDHQIYATRSFADSKTEGLSVHNKIVTEIVGVSYEGDEMRQSGSVVVDGYVKDQYSLDEYEGYLRVVTTTETRIDSFNQSGGRGGNVTADVMVDIRSNNTSANLYCINLDSWKIDGQVIGFAPVGETVRSVRFDQNEAYVCTAVQVTDPVFFFDLSDVKNITYKDTGTISGFSTSLINMGDGYLLGIGVDSAGGLKLEIYEESELDVVSVCDYIRENANYSADYKSYYVNRENQLIGLGIDDYEARNSSGDHSEMMRYILVFFDGYELRELLDVKLAGDPSIKRAVYIDGYFYMIGENDFRVEKIGG